MDNRKKYYLVLDTETANGLNDPLVYDIGYAVCDKNGNIYEQDSLIIYDIFVREKALMSTAYYTEKIPMYENGLKAKKHRLVNFLTAQKIIKEVINRWNIKEVAAYNAHFDFYKSLNTTLRYITKSEKRYFLPYGIKVICIWNMACQVLYTQKTFLKWAIDNDYISPSGNIITNAEIGYKYLTQNHDFEEEHTGLSDVQIEVALLSRCLRQHKKFERGKGVYRMCWKIPTTQAKNEGLF